MSEQGILLGKVDKNSLMSSVNISIGSRTYGEIKSISDKPVIKQSGGGNLTYKDYSSSSKLLNTPQKSSPTSDSSSSSVVGTSVKSDIKTSVQPAEIMNRQQNKTIQTGGVNLNQDIKSAVSEKVKSGSSTTAPIKTSIANVGVRFNLDRTALKKYAKNVKGDLNNIIKYNVSTEKLKRVLLAKNIITVKSGKAIILAPKKVIEKSSTGIKRAVNPAKIIAKGSLGLSSKIGNSAVGAFGNSLSGSDDMGAQSLGMAVKSIHAAPGAVKTATGTVRNVGKGVKTSTKVAIRTSKGTINAIRTLNQVGVKGAGKLLGKKTALMFNKAGRSIISLILSGLKGLAIKFAVPLSIIILVVAFFIIISTAPIVLFKAGLTRSYGMVDADNTEIAKEYYDALDKFYDVYNVRRNQYNTMINSLYHNSDYWYLSNIMRLLRHNPNGTISTFYLRIATNAAKTAFKNAWNYPIGSDFPENERLLIAIVYIKLQKDENNKRNTIGITYPIKYTKATFETVLNNLITFSYTVSTEQECLSVDCYYIPSKDEYKCLELHKRYDFTLKFKSIESLIETFNFSEDEKQWLDWIVRDFEFNPEITPPT